MSAFKNIYGQDLAIQILESAIYKKHLSPAYLFSGPEGVGRKKTAKVFIRNILEKNLESEETIRKIENNNHPDLLWIEPSYLLQGKPVPQGKAKLESLSIKSSPIIRLSQIKEIIEFLGKKPLEAERSIVIIEDIEKMNESAANALLKTLEEPNIGLFILITQRPEKLLSTIRSRCQIVPFLRLNNDEINRIIQKLTVLPETHNIPYQKIQDLLSFAYGSPGRYLSNLQYWLDISNALSHEPEIKLASKAEVLKLSKEITDELTIEQQLWFINFQQNRAWEEYKDSAIVSILETLRRQLISHVQPRLAWEVTLLEINFNN